MLIAEVCERDNFEMVSVPGPRGFFQQGMDHFGAENVVDKSSGVVAFPLTKTMEDSSRDSHARTRGFSRMSAAATTKGPVL